MSDYRPHSGKGDTPTEICDRAVRECWSTRELLTRAGIPDVWVLTRVGLLAAGDSSPVDAAALHAAIIVRSSVLPEFVIDCGPIGVLPRIFGERWREWVQAVGAGEFSEERLRREFVQSQAYEARGEILAKLRAAGHKVNDDLALPF